MLIKRKKKLKRSTENRHSQSFCSSIKTTWCQAKILYRSDTKAVHTKKESLGNSDTTFQADTTPHMSGGLCSEMTILKQVRLSRFQIIPLRTPQTGLLNPLHYLLQWQELRKWSPSKDWLFVCSWDRSGETSILDAPVVQRFNGFHLQDDDCLN